MYKILIAILVSIIPYLQPFAIAQFEQSEVTATGTEIEGYDAHVKAANQFWNVFNANFESIKTWQGKVAVVKKTWVSKKKEELLYHLEYDVDFYDDTIEKRCRYVSTGKFGISFSTGKREPTLLEREAALMLKDEIFGSAISTYTSHHYMDEVPLEKRSEYASTLTITTSAKHLNMEFYPKYHGFPRGGMEAVRNIFDVFDLEKRQCEYRAQGLLEEQITELLAQLRENGFPKHWKLSTNGEFLYFDADYNMHYTWDLSRGGWITLFTSGKYHWTCELQQVSQIWIPKKITIEIEHSDGNFSTEEMIWTQQKLNAPIDEQLWTVPSLGVRRGDQGYDARTKTAFIVEGAEYLPSIEKEKAEALIAKTKNRWKFFHYAAMLIGIGLIIYGLCNKKSKFCSPSKNGIK